MNAGYHKLVIKRGGTLSHTIALGQGAKRAITAFADAGSGNVTVTSAGHGKSDGDRVKIVAYNRAQGRNYNGSYTVANAAANTFTIVATWHGTVTGTLQDSWDLAGMTGRGAVKYDYTDAAAAADLTVSITDEPGGVVSFSLSATLTAGLTTDDTGVWDLELVDGTTVYPVLYGPVEIQPEV